MKGIFLSSVIISLFLLSSCTSDQPVSPNIETQQGGILLNFDRTHKPANVVSVTAYLTRADFDTISGTLNLISDTTADITFNDLAAGGWHLKIDAADENQIVVYSGETDVQILAGITTQIYLTLESTGAGSGNIHITVGWGIPASTDWIDYENNPVFTNAGSPYGINGVGNPHIIIENGVYKMWYKNLENNGVGSIGYAESNNGISWTIIGGGQVIAPGPIGTWDAGMVTPGPVIKEDGIYKMYYSGAIEAHQSGQIGLATSTDGINWTKYPQPVITSGSGWDYSINSNSLIKIDGTYYLYYHGWEPPDNFREGLATSTDGINWTPYEGNPILTPSQSWEGTGTYYGSVIYENNSFKMVYMNYLTEDMGFGKASSYDGIHWTKDMHNPCFKGSNTANNWTDRPLTPFMIKVNNIYRVYYNSTATYYHPQEIGFLTINNL
jgi:predicted GH43/DUF377 family glycosyl hydrolase